MKKTQLPLFAKLSLLIVSFFGILFFVNSCKPKDDGGDPPVVTPTKNMYELISGTNYSIFKSLIEKAGWADLLKSTTKYTLFAPSNDVLIAAGFPNFDALTAADASTFVKLHMMTDIKNSLNLPSSDFVPTLHTGGPSGTAISAFVSVTGNIITVNGRQVVVSHNATNGVVHDIEDLLVWYNKSGGWRVPTVYDLITFTSILSQYRVGVDLESATTKTYFSGTDLYTALAANNDGLLKYLKSVDRTFTSLPPSDRRKILDNSTVPGNLRSSAMTSGSLSTKGAPLKILVGTNITINDSVSVKQEDGQAVNGVIHIVNKPLNYN